MDQLEDTFEALVGAAILTDKPKVRELNMARYIVKAAVCRKIFCNCGNILDQKRATVWDFQDATGKTIRFLDCVCDRCMASAKAQNTRKACIEIAAKVSADQQTDIRLVLTDWKHGEQRQ